MLAPIHIRIVRDQPVAAVLALVVALLLGAALGYGLRAVSVVSATTRLVVVHDGQTASSPGDFGCIFVERRKAC